MDGYAAHCSISGWSFADRSETHSCGNRIGSCGGHRSGRAGYESLETVSPLSGISSHETDRLT
jgi:hypothetical protein